MGREGVATHLSQEVQLATLAPGGVGGAEMGGAFRWRFLVGYRCGANSTVASPILPLYCCKIPHSVNLERAD